jgi:dephospho-CoA kinase
MMMLKKLSLKYMKAYLEVNYNMKKIILVSGKARSGKGEFSKFLKQKLENQNNKVVQTFFAKYLKQYSMDLGWDGISKDEYWREFLQNIGTELIQEQLNMKTFHPKRISEDIIILNCYGIDYFIIDDCRFKREVYYIKSVFPNDVITIRIESNNSRSDLNNEQLQHKSEIDLDDFKFDFIIKNDGNLEELDNKVDIFIKQNL